MQISRIAFFLACNALVATGFSESPDPKVAQSPSWPEIWGDFGVRGYVTGDRVAPNGFEFDPLFDVDFHLNIGLLPQKKLYTFLDGDFWGQRATPGVTNTRYGSYDFSKREYDIAAGLAWNVFDRLELRGSFFAFNNLNRGSSETVSNAYQDGAVFAARYYLGDANIYDTGRLSFISLGYYPEENLVGGGGTEFRAGLFAEAYGSYDLPALRSYLYIDAKLIGQNDVDPRLVRIDGGVGIRPFPSLPNLELRVGDEFNADLKDDINHNLVYGAGYVYFGGGTSDPSTNQRVPAIYDAACSPEIWGDFGFSANAAGRRIAPNGVEFTPLFMSNVDFNIGILPARKLYFFVDSQFWVQRQSATGDVPSRDPERDDVSEREWDFDGGLALTLFTRFELRGSLYAQNNLNRGGSTQQSPGPVSPSGYHDGGYLQIRYYFTLNLYDPSRQSFVELGYYPSSVSISGEGSGVHPRAFGRLYLSQDLPRIRSYVYGDGTVIAEKDALGLITVNAGLAVRPFPRFGDLEFRIGNEFTREIGVTTRDLTYGAIRINFSTR